MFFSVFWGSVLAPQIWWKFKFLRILFWGALSGLHLVLQARVHHLHKRLGTGTRAHLAFTSQHRKGSYSKPAVQRHILTVLCIDVIIWAGNIFRSSSTFLCQTAQTTYKRGRKSSGCISYPSFVEEFKGKYKGRMYIWNRFQFLVNELTFCWGGCL